jgi:hypothetical protein
VAFKEMTTMVNSLIKNLSSPCVLSDLDFLQIRDLSTQLNV